MSSASNVRFSAKYRTQDQEIQATNIAVVLFKEDNVHIAYSPALDLSGYGATEEEARASFEVVLREFLNYSTVKKTLKEELKRLGWTFKGKKMEVVRAPSVEELAASNEALQQLTKNGTPLRVFLKPVQLFANA